MAFILVRASSGAARAAASAASRCAAAAAAASSCVGSGGGGAGAVSSRLLIPRGSPAAFASSPRLGRAGLSSYSNWDDSDEFYDLDCRFHVDEGDSDNESQSDYSGDDDDDDSDGEEREVVHSAEGTRCWILREQGQKDEYVVEGLPEAI